MVLSCVDELCLVFDDWDVLSVQLRGGLGKKLECRVKYDKLTVENSQIDTCTKSVSDASR